MCGVICFVESLSVLFFAETKTKYAVCNVLVTTYGVLDGKNYSIVDKEIILDDLFV